LLNLNDTQEGDHPVNQNYFSNLPSGLIRFLLTQLRLFYALIILESSARSRHKRNTRDRRMKMLNAVFQDDSEILSGVPCDMLKDSIPVFDNTAIPRSTVGAFSSGS